MQVIVVDDNSDDECRPALQTLEAEFSWVTFFYSPQTKGAGHARNVGLEHVKGRYIFFADADDFFNYCIGQVFDDYAECTHDVVFFNANSVDTDVYTTRYRQVHLNEMIRYHSKNPRKAIFELKYAFGEPWCKMVRRELIEENKIRFSETIIHNDTRYSYLVGFYSKDVLVDKRAVYCRTDRAGSVSLQVSQDRLLVRTAVFAEANRFFKEHHIDRFDERMLRPLLCFLAKGNIPGIRQCVRIMKDNGMTSSFIFLRCLFYPFYILGKSEIICKRILLRFVRTMFV